MKRLLLILALIALPIVVSARYTFSKWEVSAIIESKDKDGNISYAVWYKGVRFDLTSDEHYILMKGEDITK